jgi:Uma2 family endonuclease
VAPVPQLISRPISALELAPGSLVTLRHITWPEFESLLADLGDTRPTRIAYSQETFEIMAPLPKHERAIVLIVDLVKTLLRVQQRPWESLRSTTFKREGVAGVEPDDCFYIQNYQAVIGKDRIDLAVDPPPDLAIESDLTSRTRLASYVALQVPELWIYAADRLKIYHLDGDQYTESDFSPTFPAVDIVGVIPYFVERASEIGTSAALIEFERSLTLPPKI